ncbi:MAG: amidohydrolase family protein, partial [Planctomycetes bacterium]|nr:amidohydrolase family protein [Planctomycetota bacterium]
MPRTGFDWHARNEPIGSEELAGFMAPFMDYCIEKFGPDRSMFESNYPVDKASISYNVLWNAFKKMAAGFSDDEKDALFRATAMRVYRLDPIT